MNAPLPAPGKAFSLVELLVVVAVIILLMALLVPSITGIKGGSDLTKTAYDIQGTLDQARAYAMSNNTFVWVGFAEEDAGYDASKNPQVPGTGRVAVAVIASKDGTKGFDGGSLPNPAWTNYGNGNNFLAMAKLQRFENVHLADLGATPPASGGMARPAVADSYRVGNTAVICVTPFDWPLGSALNSGQYSFKMVVTFDPQGVARIQGTGDIIPQYLEIGLQPTHGNTFAQTGPNVAAIQINGITGATRIFRP